MSKPTKEQIDDDFMHIYGQVTYHDDALIVGTRGAIQQLRDACDRALEAGEHEFDAFASDGEGYNTMVRIVADVYVLDELPTHYIENCYTVKWERTQATNDVLERAAVVAWTHYMDQCKLLRVAASANEHWLASGAIRAMKVPT